MTKTVRSQQLSDNPPDDVDSDLTPEQSLTSIEALENPPPADAALKALVKRKPIWTADGDR